MAEAERGSPDNPGMYEIPERKVTLVSKGSGQGMQTLERCSARRWSVALRLVMPAVTVLQGTLCVQGRHNEAKTLPVSVLPVHVMECLPMRASGQSLTHLRMTKPFIRKTQSSSIMPAALAITMFRVAEEMER